MPDLNNYNKDDVYKSYRRYQDDLDLALTHCLSSKKIDELRSLVLFIQEKIKQLEILERENSFGEYTVRND